MSQAAGPSLNRCEAAPRCEIAEESQGSGFHEALVSLFRNRPTLAPELLRDALRHSLPAHDRVEVQDADLRVETTGAGKLIMLLQCWGSGNLDSIGRAFPEAQVFSSVDSTTAWSDDRVFVDNIRSFLRGDSWETMMRSNTWSAKDVDPSGWRKLYFAPNTRQVIEHYVDLDQERRVRGPCGCPTRAPTRSSGRPPHRSRRWPRRGDGCSPAAHAALGSVVHGDERHSRP